ncbi:uncharacterized protein LOC129751933 [Uranotaenia lowii]|uniref:uncharacterized protein LOC129751933 n=1 Tax=Uranotaenia lowii TaxID=190385 RepID=UPI002479C0E5|nr:uncharacterized protein LOC129751933 [Uranotaenia lowii]
MAQASGAFCDRDDQQFYETASSIISMMFLFPVSERNVIKEWLNALYQMGDCKPDKQMRNRYASFLLMQLEVNRGLSAPFDKSPPGRIHQQLHKILDVNEYIGFFEKCEKFYLLTSTENPREPSQPDGVRIKPSDFLYKFPSIHTGIKTYGACFSNDDGSQ